jgi:hypothetical protein
MQIFEAALLWGAALQKWEYLKRVGLFPEPDSCISDGYCEQERNLYLALGALLREATKPELEALLERAATGQHRGSSLAVSVIRACLARDDRRLNIRLAEFLSHYKRSEFPEEKMTKKISIVGTFLVHWARKEGLAVVVPGDFMDHIVRRS